MDIRHKFRHRKHRRGDTAELAAQLAPLEEQNRHAAEKQRVGVPANGVHREVGAIVVENDVHRPQDIAPGTQPPVLGLDPVVFVILLLMLAFVVFIAWQITLLPID